LAIALLSEIVWKVCTTSNNSLDGRWGVGGPAKGDGRGTGGDYLGDGRNEGGRSGSASEVGGTISEVLRVDIHTLPFSLDGSVAVVFVAVACLSCSDSHRG